MKNRVKFAELLIEYRGRCGWSQSELGMRLGSVHRNTVALWEQGTIPSREMVFRLVDELRLHKQERREFLNVAGFSIEHWPADYWSVPYRTNPYFVGRETVLQSLRKALVPGAKTTALTQSISGLGGIGKTQVAIEYAHRYGEYYEAVFWIQADSPEVATSAYLQLATQVLGLPEQQEAEQQVMQVKHWLQKRHNWLLIFDNVEDPQGILSKFVPSKHQGSVLITTRRRDVGPWAHSEVLSLLAEDDAILFLLRRSRGIGKKASITEASANEVSLARDLCQLLDRLPLALDQAGAYIAETGCTLQHYIQLYQQFRGKVLDQRNAGDHSNQQKGSNHPESVLTTFWLSWDQIQQRNVLAGKALEFCAFLAPDQIPESLVANGILSTETNSTSDLFEFNNALGLLHRYSLLERTEQMLSLHRLVQAVLQEVLSEKERHCWMERAVLVINGVFPSGEYETWSLCEFLLPHAFVCAKWIPLLGQGKLGGTRLLNAVGGYLHDRAQYVEAEPLCQQALAIVEEQLGALHPITAISLNNLAELYQSQGRYVEAEPLYQRALTIAEEQLGGSHSNTATCVHNLAALYRVQGRYVEAEPLYQRALHIREEQLGALHPDVAASLNGLALLYESQGRYVEAEPLYQRALHIQEEQLGGGHPDTATSLINLAELYQSQGRYAEAEPLYQRALAIIEEQLGAFHPVTADCLNNLAELYRVQGRYVEAKPLYQRALHIREEQLGASHPATATSLHNLALLYESQGQYAEAESLCQRALAIAEEQLGASHPYTGACLCNLALFYKSREQYTEAEPLLQRALKIAEERLGISHPDTATCLDNLASLYASQERYIEAESLYQRALHIREEQLGASHPDIGASLNNLASLYVSQGRYAEAEPLYRGALAIAEEQLGVSHPRTAASLNNLAELYKSQGRYAEAEPLYQNAFKVSLASLGMEHPQSQQIMMNYLTLLAEVRTGGDLEALLQLINQGDLDREK